MKVLCPHCARRNRQSILASRLKDVWEFRAKDHAYTLIKGKTLSVTCRPCGNTTLIDLSSD